MFSRKIKKMIRNPNLFLRDYFAKRVKTELLVGKPIDSRLDSDPSPLDGRANAKEAYFINLPYKEGVHPWIQLSQQMQLRTGATNGHRNQSMVLNAINLIDFLFYAMFLATRLQAGMRIFTLGGAVNKTFNIDALSSPKRASILAGLYKDLQSKPDFCLELLGDVPDAFAAHVFIYDVSGDGIYTMRSEKAYMRRATREVFEVCYPQQDPNGSTWEFDVRMPIDIVYTWVNRDDAGWQNLWNTAFPDRPAANDRYSSKDELRYSLRSISKFMPWARNIYVVSNCQKPEWLSNNPRLKWVGHEDIFPDTSVLPNFNSHSIESCLHRIPGLSENFVYFNDDFFVTQPVYPEDFFDHTGRSIARLEPYGTIFPDNEFDDTREYLAPSITSHRLLAQRFPDYRATRLHTHTPYALQISILREIEAFIGQELNDTRSYRSRTKHDINLPSFFYHHYALATGQAITHRDPSLIVRPQNIGSLIRKQHIESYKFLCFNDGDGSADDQTYLDNFETVMARHFAHPCQFERPSIPVGHI